MWIRLATAATVVAVLALAALFDDARRDSDGQRRAEIAAERLHAAIHHFTTIDLRADAGTHPTLMAGEVTDAIRTQRAAAAELRQLRPREADVRAALAAASRLQRVTGHRITLFLHGRIAEAEEFDNRVVDLAIAHAESRIEPVSARLTREADATYERGARVLAGGFATALAMLLGLAAGVVRSRRRAQAARSERRQAALAERASDVVTLVGPDGAIRWQSASGPRLFMRDAPPLGAPIGALFDDAGAAIAADTVSRLLLEPGTSLSFTATVTGADGAVRAFETLADNRLGDGDIGALVLTSRDVTDRVRLEHELRRRAFHDDLTGLPNRALFEDRLQHALAGARRGGRVGVMFVDLDDFKTVNDSLGHAAGDELLRIAASRIDGVLRPGDTVARMGGDEFAILLEQVGDADEVEAIADRVIEALRAPATIADRRLATRGSVGIALSHPAAQAGDLLRNADVAMYAAKTRGDGGWSLFDPSMHEDAILRLELSAELPAAIERGELELHYQPIVGLDGEPTGGAEALVRWRHPVRGLLAPGEFIALAETTGAIVPLGRWVLGQACADLARWQAQAGALRLFVSVNVSPVQLADDGFVDHVRTALAAAAVEPSALMLEVTESAFTGDADDAVRRLRELRALGVRTAIDDFGTGHSALSSLRRLPVDVLKIDRSFVSELTARPEARKVLAGVVQLGRSLDLDIIAEGVEREDQARELAALGATSAQGFLYGRPRPVTDPGAAPHLALHAAS